MIKYMIINFLFISETTESSLDFSKAMKKSLFISAWWTDRMSLTFYLYLTALIKQRSPLYVVWIILTDLSSMGKIYLLFQGCLADTELMQKMKKIAEQGYPPEFVGIQPKYFTFRNDDVKVLDCE